MWTHVTHICMDIHFDLDSHASFYSICTSSSCSSSSSSCSSSSLANNSQVFERISKFTSYSCWAVLFLISVVHLSSSRVVTVFFSLFCLLLAPVFPLPFLHLWFFSLCQIPWFYVLLFCPRHVIRTCLCLLLVIICITLLLLLLIIISTVFSLPATVP